MTRDLSDSGSLTERGIAALRGGDTSSARGLLADAIAANPDNADAWLWLSGAVSEPAERRYCLLRVQALQPAHPFVARGLAMLPAVEPRSPLPTEAPPSPVLEEPPSPALEESPSPALEEASPLVLEEASPPTLEVPPSPALEESPSPALEEAFALASSNPTIAAPEEAAAREHPLLRETGLQTTGAVDEPPSDALVDSPATAWRPRRRWRAVLAGLAALVLLLGVGFVALRPRLLPTSAQVAPQPTEAVVPTLEASAGSDAATAPAALPTAAPPSPTADSASAVALAARGAERVRNGDAQGALDDFSAALATDPSLVEAYLGRAAIHADFGMLSTALADYSAAIELAPSSFEAVFGRGYAYRHYLGDPSAALADFDRAVELRPNDAAARCERAATRARLGDAQGALDDAAALVERTPDAPCAPLQEAVERYRALGDELNAERLAAILER
jgi:tetratricopeptide (TPR) repeat protein